jgi:hypothetical protein
MTGEPLGPPTGSARSDLPPPGAVVKMRLAGPRRGCAEAARRLHGLFYVTAVSEAYAEPGSARLVQVFVRVRLDRRPEPPPAAAGGTS